MTVIEYKNGLDEINNRLENASNALQGFSRNELGLCERTDEYLKAKKQYDTIFIELRNFGSELPKGLKNKLSREVSKANRKLKWS